MNVRIACFSGTGSTLYVAEAFRREWENRNHSVEITEIGRCYETEAVTSDLLILCYAVHAFNAPLPVLRWIKSQSGANRTPAVVISVSGGGEVTPNLACRVSAKKLLRKMNFRVTYEKMIVMPSNWIVPTKKALTDGLLEILPFKVSHCINEILAGKERHIKAGPGNRLLSLLGRLEHLAAGKFGEKIIIEPTCNGCGLCAFNCPVGNISMADNRPLFSHDCVLCLQCLYGCPKKALKPGWGKFVTIPGGYDFKSILREKSDSTGLDPEKEAEGVLWLGVKRYLSDRSDLSPPASPGSKD